MLHKTTESALFRCILVYTLNKDNFKFRHNNFRIAGKMQSEVQIDKVRDVGTAVDGNKLNRAKTSRPVLVVTINRPHRKNAVDRATAFQLFTAFKDFDEDDDFSVAILTGSCTCKYSFVRRFSLRTMCSRSILCWGRYHKSYSLRQSSSKSV